MKLFAFPLSSPQVRPAVCLTAGLAALLMCGAPRAVLAAPAPAVATTLPNGLTLVSRNDHLAPRVALSLLVRAGAADEDATNSGWRRLLSDAMLLATRSAPDGQPGSDVNVRTPLALQRAAEALGGRVGATVADDVIEFWAVGDSAKAAPLLDLLLSEARFPRLADADIDQVRRRLVDTADLDQDEVATRTTSALRSQLYRNQSGQLTAYGLPASGTPESLQVLTNDKIRELHRSYFTPSRMVLSAAGDVDVNALRPALEKIPALEARAEQPAPLFRAPNRSDPPLIVRQMRTPGAWVFIGYAVAGLGQADLPALRVLAAALSEAPRARLPQRLLNARLTLNNAEALASQVAVQLTPRRFASEMVVFAQTDDHHLDATKNAMLDEVRRLRETPLARYELESAKNYVVGSWAVEREGLRERAFQAGLAVVLNAPADASWPSRAQKVQAADVRRVARKYLAAYAVALVMPQEPQR